MSDAAGEAPRFDDEQRLFEATAGLGTIELPEDPVVIIAGQEYRLGIDKGELDSVGLEAQEEITDAARFVVTQRKPAFRVQIGFTSPHEELKSEAKGQTPRNIFYDPEPEDGGDPIIKILIDKEVPKDPDITDTALAQHYVAEKINKLINAGIIEHIYFSSIKPRTGNAYRIGMSSGGIIGAAGGGFWAGRGFEHLSSWELWQRPTIGAALGAGVVALVAGAGSLIANLNHNSDASLRLGRAKWYADHVLAGTAGAGRFHLMRTQAVTLNKIIPELTPEEKREHHEMMVIDYIDPAEDLSEAADEEEVEAVTAGYRHTIEGINYDQLERIAVLIMRREPITKQAVRLLVVCDKDERETLLKMFEAGEHAPDALVRAALDRIRFSTNIDDEPEAAQPAEP